MPLIRLANTQRSVTWQPVHRTDKSKALHAEETEDHCLKSLPAEKVRATTTRVDLHNMKHCYKGCLVEYVKVILFGMAVMVMCVVSYKEKCGTA